MFRRVVVIACALALGLGACSNTAPVAGDRTGASTTPATSTTAAEPGTTAAGSPTPTTAQPDAGAPTDPTAPGEPAGDPDDAPTAPPAPGTYRYAQDGETTFGPFTFEPDLEGTLTIHPARSSGAGRTQRQVRQLSRNQSMEQVLSFGAGGVSLVSFVTRFATQTYACELDRPLLAIELPVRVGSSWSDRSSCDGIDLRLNGEILRRESRTVEGERVPTVVVRTVVRATGDGLEQTTRATIWVSEAHRLIVRAVERSEGTVDGTPYASSRTDDLLSLTPGS